MRDFLEMWMKQALFGNLRWKCITSEYSEPPTSYVVKPVGITYDKAVSGIIQVRHKEAFLSPADRNQNIS